MTIAFTTQPRWHSSAPRFFLRKLLLFLLAIALLFLIMIFPLFSRLLILDASAETILFSSSVRSNNQFVISFIHSTNLTPVEDYYRIEENNTITLTETHFESYSVGMPSELSEGEVLELAEGKIIIKNMNRNYSQIDLRIGQLIANHHLLINGKELDLANLSAPGALVRIKAANLSIFELLSGRFRPWKNNK